MKWKLLPHGTTSPDFMSLTRGTGRGRLGTQNHPSSLWSIVTGSCGRELGQDPVPPRELQD